MVHKEKQVDVNLTLHSIKLLEYKLQSINLKKIKNQIMHKSNKLFMTQTKIKSH